MTKKEEEAFAIGIVIAAAVTGLAIIFGILSGVIHG